MNVMAYVLERIVSQGFQTGNAFQNPVEKKVVTRLAYTPCRVLSCASRFQKFRTAFFSHLAWAQKNFNGLRREKSGGKKIQGRSEKRVGRNKSVAATEMVDGLPIGLR
jgi:hypothetical protein